MGTYIVKLPGALPVVRADRELHVAYGGVKKTGVTEAPSEKKAITNIIFRGCRDAGLARRISSYILDSDRCEVYEVPVVVEENGEISTSPDTRFFRECFLAQRIANRRGMPDEAGRYLGEARAFLRDIPLPFPERKAEGSGIGQLALFS